jgi:DNA-binding MarR family transcriptional regulator
LVAGVSQDVVGVPRDAVDEAALDAVLTASRTLVVVLASRGPQRLVDLATALEVTPSTAGRMGDRLVRKGLIRRHRSRVDRRSVQVSITAAGRQVVDQATARRRELLAQILGRLPAGQQAAVASALEAFAAAAGEVPDRLWPAAEPELPGGRPARAASGRPAGPARATAGGRK